MLTLRGEHFCFGPLLRAWSPRRASQVKGEACSNAAVLVVFGHFLTVEDGRNYQKN
jgi:hypothetical protein